MSRSPRFLSETSPRPWKPPENSDDAIFNIFSIRNNAFTLVELLVVIAIIAVLAALGYPALQISHETGESAQCASNLRTIGAAAQQFSNNNGRILTWDTNNGFIPFAGRWHQALAPTLGNTGPEAEWTGTILKKIYAPLACPSILAAYRFVSGYGVTYAANSFADKQSGWPPPANWTAAGNNVFFPHQGKCNVLFLDGHVESFSKAISAKCIIL
jgi:prepilin-type N-terminal cleavage/methylation domain-containing protein/prepilin-type processing-associated H-X9-DG protein